MAALELVIPQHLLPLRHLPVLSTIINSQTRSSAVGSPQRGSRHIHHGTPRALYKVKKFQFLYNQIDSKSLEDKVDNFWTELLRRYFYQDEYIITQNARPADNDMKKVDFIIQTVSGPNSAEHVVLVEDKRHSLATQDQEWKNAVVQLTKYMIQARDADKRKQGIKKADPLPYPIYGIVNAGKYSRFYVLYPRNVTLQDLPGTHGTIFHLKNNEKDIMKLLTELVDATYPQVSSSSSAPTSAAASAASSRHGSPSRPGSSSGAVRTASPAAGMAPTTSAGASAKPKPKP